MRLLSLIALLAVTAASCGGAAPPKAAEPPPPAAPVDSLDGFMGVRVETGVTVRVAGSPVGVESLGLLVSVVKTNWQSMGDDRMATAILVVQRGVETKRIYVPEGESREVLGCRITVSEAGETYDKETMRYPAYADMVIEPAPATE